MKNSKDESKNEKKTNVTSTTPKITPLETDANKTPEADANTAPSFWQKCCACCLKTEEILDPIVIEAGRITGIALKLTVGTFIQASPLPAEAKIVATNLANMGIDALGTSGLAAIHKLDEVAMEHATKAMGSKDVKQAVKSAADAAIKAAKDGLPSNAGADLSNAEKALVDQVKKAADNAIANMNNLTAAQKTALTQATDISIDNLNKSALEAAMADLLPSLMPSGNNTLKTTAPLGITLTNIPTEQLQNFMLAKVNEISGLEAAQKRAVLDLFDKTLGSIINNAHSSASDASVFNTSSISSSSTSTGLLVNKDISSSSSKITLTPADVPINPTSLTPFSSSSPAPTPTKYTIPKKQTDYAGLLDIDSSSVVLAGLEDTPTSHV